MGGTEGLPVRTIPEQDLVTTVRDAVIDDIPIRKGQTPMSAFQDDLSQPGRPNSGVAHAVHTVVMQQQKFGPSFLPAIVITTLAAGFTA